MMQTAPPPSEYKKSGFRITKSWFVTLVACGLAVYVVIQNERSLSGVTLGPARMDFGGVAALDPKKAQAVVEELKEGATAPEIKPPPPAGEREREEIQDLKRQQPALVPNARLEDVVGVWHDGEGTEIRILALGGNLLAYNEVSTLIGIPVQTASGQGTWSDGRFELVFNTVYGVPGVASLQPGAKGTLVGTAVVQGTGVKVPLTLTR